MEGVGCAGPGLQVGKGMVTAGGPRVKVGCSSLSSWAAAWAARAPRMRAAVFMVDVVGKRGMYCMY